MQTTKQRTSVSPSRKSSKKSGKTSGKTHADDADKLGKRQSSKERKKELANIKPKSTNIKPEMSVVSLMRRSGNKHGGSSSSSAAEVVDIAGKVIDALRAKIEALFTVESAILKVLDDTDKLRSIVTMQDLLGDTITHIRGTNKDLQGMMAALADMPVQTDPGEQYYMPAQNDPDEQYYIPVQKPPAEPYVPLVLSQPEPIKRLQVVKLGGTIHITDSANSADAAVVLGGVLATANIYGGKS